jgi:hypothetical protein
MSSWSTGVSCLATRNLQKLLRSSEHKAPPRRCGSQACTGGADQIARHCWVPRPCHLHRLCCYICLCCCALSHHPCIRGQWSLLTQICIRPRHSIWPASTRYSSKRVSTAADMMPGSGWGSRSGASVCNNLFPHLEGKKLYTGANQHFLDAQRVQHGASGIASQSRSVDCMAR